MESFFGEPNLERPQLLRWITETAKDHLYVLIGSPPATGKTSLLQILAHTIKTPAPDGKEDFLKKKVCYIRVSPDGVDDLKAQFLRDTG